MASFFARILLLLASPPLPAGLVRGATQTLSLDGSWILGRPPLTRVGSGRSKTSPYAENLCNEDLFIQALILQITHLSRMRSWSQVCGEYGKSPSADPSPRSSSLSPRPLIFVRCVAWPRLWDSVGSSHHLPPPHFKLLHISFPRFFISEHSERFDVSLMV